MSIWKTAKLGDVVTIERKALQPDEIRAGTLYVGLEHIESGGRLLDVQPIAEGGLASAKFEFTHEHVLYGKLRPYLAKIADPQICGICSTDILPIRPGKDIHKRFLLHHLRRPEIVEFANRNAVGVNLPRVSPNVLLQLPISVPSWAEQQRIADVLDRAEALRAKRRASLAAFDSLAAAFFIESFGDPLMNPKSWPIFQLQELVASGRIITYGIVQAGPETADGVPYIKTGDIQNGEIDPTTLSRTGYEIAARYQRSMVRAGDIVMSIRATVGTTAIVPPELHGANLTQGTARISPGPMVTGPFLLWYLRSRAAQVWIERQIKGATFREITLHRLRELPVFVPPRTSQEKFVSIDSILTKLRKRQIESLSNLNILFSSLQQRAFRGEL